MAYVKTRTIVESIAATADDWQLFDQPGRDEAAHALNESFKASVNAEKTRSEVYHDVKVVMEKHSSFGATASKGFRMLEILANETFRRADQW